MTLWSMTLWPVRTNLSAAFIPVWALASFRRYAGARAFPRARMDQFSIVFVCSGNRFRSPLAEALVRRLTFGLPVVVQSFGTLPLGAAPALAEARRLGLSLGIDLSEHRARLLGVESIEDADLVIGFDQDHVRRGVIDGNASTQRSFAFRQLVALLEEAAEPETDDVVHRARQAVEHAALRRDATIEAWEIGAIADPLGRSWRVYRETAAEIRHLSLKLVDALFGVNGAEVLPELPAGFAPRWARRKRRPRIFPQPE
jgi:protein-tyrosine phosphatase